jgi:hypothetical protein
MMRSDISWKLERGWTNNKWCVPGRYAGPDAAIVVKGESARQSHIEEIFELVKFKRKALEFLKPRYKTRSKTGCSGAAIGLQDESITANFRNSRVRSMAPWSGCSFPRNEIMMP